MLKPKKKWDLVKTDQDTVTELSHSLACSPLIAQLLYNRGLKESEEARSFLHSESVPYHDPFLMLGMDETVERLSLAIENEENILVFGDYDADGVTSTSVMVLGLRELGAHVTYYIPDRFKEGYGPNIPALEKAKKNGVTLVITVDTGISALEVAAFAKTMGLDYIVTDHHEPPPELPDAYAIINPKQPGCGYPFKGLSGVGVAVKVIQALFDDVPTHLLDLVAVGTISDLVPLKDENRRLVKEGLQVLSSYPKPGLKALLKVIGHVDNKIVDSELVGFQLGPRLNAAGRLEHASFAADLLMCEDLTEALPLAEQLNQLNEERKAYVERISQEAIAMVEPFPVEDRDFIIVFNEGWHEGVLGIVASRLVELYYRPTLVLTVNPETGMAKGSARSIEDFDLFQALSTCRDLLPHFGGHEMAAGLSLGVDHIEELRERMNRYARQVMTDEMLIPKVRVEAKVKLSNVTVEWVEALSLLEPFGEGNPKPLFWVDQVSIKDMKQIGASKDHLKLQLEDGAGGLDAISFRNGHLALKMTNDTPLSVIGQFGINEWNGFRKPQLFIDDFSISEWQLFDLRGQSKWQDVMREEAQDCQAVFFRDYKESYEAVLSNVYPYSAYLSEPINHSSSLVLLDLPESLDQLTHFLQEIPFPEKLYLVFDQDQASTFEAVPSRDHFKQVFSLFYKHPNITIQKLKQWAQYKKWSMSRIDFIIKVFLELEFVKMEQDVLTPVPASSKKPLTDSRTYNARMNRAEVEELLLYSSKKSVREWLDERKAERLAPKEDILS